MYETLEVEREGALMWVTMNRPASSNAMSRTLIAEMRDVFSNLVSDRATHVVVLRGAGKNFCGGLDLKESGSADGAVGDTVASGLRVQRNVSGLTALVCRAPQPVIAAVQGAAAGGGFALALAADVRIAAENARMNAAFIRLGLTGCDVGVSYLLPRAVGSSVASELLLTGSFIDAARAERIGLVSRVVPESELEFAARAMAEAMLRNAPLSLRLTKECLRHNVDAGSLEQAIALEDRNQILAAQTEDFAEGVRAFVEGRAPEFRGR